MTEALGDVRNALGEARKRDPTTEQPEAEPETEKSQEKRPGTEPEQETEPEPENVVAATAPWKEPEVKQTQV